MIIYYIDVPFVSKGLKRTYYKKLEVFAGEENNYKNLRSVSPNNIYKCNKDGIWSGEHYGKLNTKYYKSVMKDLSELPKTTYKSNYGLAFESLELAKAAKIILVKQLGETYLNEIKKLQDTFERNVPDVEVPLQIVKANYPEYFI